MSGGLLGTALPTVELSQSEFTPDEAAAWADVERSGVLEQDVGPSEPGAGGDEYQYDLTIRRGGRAQVLRFTEFAMPPELTPLIDLLELRAEATASGR